MMHRFYIEPMGAPRTTRADTWKKRPIILKYHAFRDAICEAIKDTGIKEAERLEVDFYVEMPKSWSAKKKLMMDGEPNKQKPDIDNMLKAFLDSVHRDGDDCKVWDVRGRKFWSYEYKIEITI